MLTLFAFRACLSYNTGQSSLAAKIAAASFNGAKALNSSNIHGNTICFKQAADMFLKKYSEKPFSIFSWHLTCSYNRAIAAQYSNGMPISIILFMLIKHTSPVKKTGLPSFAAFTASKYLSNSVRTLWAAQLDAAPWKDIHWHYKITILPLHASCTIHFLDTPWWYTWQYIDSCINAYNGFVSKESQFSHWTLTWNQHADIIYFNK